MRCSRDRTAGKGTLKLCELLQQCSANDLLYGLSMKTNTTMASYSHYKVNYT